MCFIHFAVLFLTFRADSLSNVLVFFVCVGKRGEGYGFLSGPAQRRCLDFCCVAPSSLPFRCFFVFMCVYFLPGAVHRAFAREPPGRQVEGAAGGRSLSRAGVRGAGWGPPGRGVWGCFPCGLPDGRSADAPLEGRGLCTAGRTSEGLECTPCAFTPRARLAESPSDSLEPRVSSAECLAPRAVCSIPLSCPLSLD